MPLRWPITPPRNAALLGMADALCSADDQAAILAANAEDMAAAKGHISDVMLDRLALTAPRIEAMAQGIREVAALPDPVGRVLNRVERPNGLVIEKTAVPMGVIAIIYESRPNVTSDAAALAIKSGNACILRCGKEAWRSANAIVTVLRQGLKKAGLPESFGLPDRGHHTRFCQCSDDRCRLCGSADPARRCRADPCLRSERQGSLHPDRHRHLPCVRRRYRRSGQSSGHHRERKSQPPQRVQRRGGVPCALCHCRGVSSPSGPAPWPGRAAKGLHPVELRLDKRAAAIISGTPAGEKDFDTEFLDYILAVKVVDSVEEAIGHIAEHSTGHSEAILTQTQAHADLFTAAVDSAAVYVNCSTRFTDGGEFGLGCEMGISTQKLHARGPMGLAELWQLQVYHPWQWSDPLKPAELIFPVRKSGVSVFSIIFII